MSTHTFGIDLGTTNSSIAHLVDGRPVAIPIDDHAIVPSVVLYLPDRVAVGREARNLELQHPESTIRSVKRRMGQPYQYDVQGRAISPVEVSAEILMTLKRGAERATGLPVQNVVITVPAYFDDAQRRATLEAGERAGLSVLRLLNEPTSASLIYDQVGQIGSPAGDGSEVVMVYDLGGGTFDVSVLEVFEGVREVRATTGNTQLGGDDFDAALVRLFLDELARAGADPRQDARAMARLRRLAETTKIRLSSELEVTVREEFLTSDRRGKPIHLELGVTRRQFEALIEPLLASTIALSRQVVEEAHLAGQRLGKICLVGGSTRIPRCRALLAEAFDVEIHEEIDPDLAVALGSSIQAGLLAGEELGRILVDVASHSLGIRAIGAEDTPYELPDTFAVVLRKNTVLPAQRTEEFYTVVADQESIKVEIFQGEAARVSQNTAVGSFEFQLRPAPAHAPVRVEFAYDLSGVVRVSVAQPGTDNAKTVALSLADAGRAAQAERGASAVERKAEALLARLEPSARGVLAGLLEALRAASGDARARAEDKLLDFFIDHDDDDAHADDAHAEDDEDADDANDEEP